MSLQTTIEEYELRKLKEDIQLLVDRGEIDFGQKQAEKEYTLEDIRKAFEESRLTHPMIGFKHETFEEYIKSIE